MEGFRRITVETKTGLTRFRVRGLWLFYNPTRYARKAPEFITIAKIGRDDNVHHCIVFYRLPTQAAQIWLPNIGRGDGRVFHSQEINSLCSCRLWFLGIKGLALDIEDSERQTMWCFCRMWRIWDSKSLLAFLDLLNHCILVVDPFSLRILSHPRDVRVLGTRCEYSSHLMSLRLSSKICGKKRVTNYHKLRS